MPKFLITQSERHAVVYEVEAATADEAEQAFNEGTANEVQVKDDIIGTDVISVEVAPAA